MAQILPVSKSRYPWQPNVLLNYQNPSYYIRLFMVSEDYDNLLLEEGVDALRKIPDDRLTILAETGASGYNITSLRMKTVFAPDRSVRFTMSREISIRLVEPGGISFLDRLFAAAAALNVRNLLSYSYYLLIKFHGYDENGNYVDTISPDPESLFWLFRIMITDISVDVGPTGAIYNIEAVDSGEVALADNIFRLPGPFSPKGRRIKDVLKELITELEREQKDQYGDYVATYYRFEIDPLPRTLGDIDVQKLVSNKLDPGEWEIYTLEPSKPQQTRSPNDPLTKDMTFSRGETLENVIYNLFVNTKEAQALVRRSQEAKTFGDDSEFILIWKIVPQVKFVDFDYVRYDYVREVTYRVTPYLSVRGIGSPKQLVPVRKGDTETLKQKLDVRISSKRLIKKYDYFWTGLNTDVLDLNIRFDTLYRAILPLYGGQTDSRIHTPSLIEDENSYVSRIVELHKQYNQINERLRKINEEIKIVEKRRETKDIYNDSLNRLLERKRELEYERIAVRIQLAEAQRTRIKEQKKEFRKYVEDVSPNKAYMGFIPVSLDRSKRVDVSEYKGNVESERPIERSMVESILNQIIGATSDMVEIEMSILGDPYWLGYSNIDPKRYLHSLDSANLSVYDTGEIMFLLNFRMPVDLNEQEIVNKEFHQSPSFSGVYVVKEVEHLFENGIFRQTLNAVRDLTVDVTRLKMD